MDKSLLGWKTRLTKRVTFLAPSPTPTRSSIPDSTSNSSSSTLNSIPVQAEISQLSLTHSLMSNYSYFYGYSSNPQIQHESNDDGQRLALTPNALTPWMRAQNHGFQASRQSMELILNPTTASRAQAISQRHDISNQNYVSVFQDQSHGYPPRIPLPPPPVFIEHHHDQRSCFHPQNKSSPAPPPPPPRIPSPPPPAPASVSSRTSQISNSKPNSKPRKHSSPSPSIASSFSPKKHPLAIAPPPPPASIRSTSSTSSRASIIPQFSIPSPSSTAPSISSRTKNHNLKDHRPQNTYTTPIDTLPVANPPKTTTKSNTSQLSNLSVRDYPVTSDEIVQEKCTICEGTKRVRKILRLDGAGLCWSCVKGNFEIEADEVWWEGYD